MTRLNSLATEIRQSVNQSVLQSVLLLRISQEAKGVQLECFRGSNRHVESVTVMHNQSRSCAVTYNSLESVTAT